MTWLSINPDNEPYSRKSAALALSRKWGDDWVSANPDKLTPTELAEIYNNAEELGLDLYSLKKAITQKS